MFNKSGFMKAIRIVPEGNYQGSGISHGLARGLLVFWDDLNLTGEGMGIGSVAVREPDCTYFSRSWDDIAEGHMLRRTFDIDTRMSWSIFGKISPLLTQWIESAIGAYMQMPSFQRILMLPVLPLRRVLYIHPVFETVPSHGQVTMTYVVKEGQVAVRAEIHSPTKVGSVICLLNELSAEWFTNAVRDETIVPPPPAWERITPKNPTASLYDPVHGIRFTLLLPSVSVSGMSPVESNIFWGREHTDDLCWAGFCIELGPLDGKQEVIEARYSIIIAGEPAT